MNAARRPLLAALATLALTACTRDPSTSAPDARGDAAPAPTRAPVDAPPHDGVLDDDQTVAPTPRPTGPGGPFIVQSQTGAVCGADLAATTFRFAACLCDDAAFAGAVHTSSYSSSDLTAPVGGGGLGANGSIGAAGELDVGGTLAAGGSVQPAGAMVVRDDLRAGGDVAFAGDGDVGGDAYVGGDVTAIGLAVDGDLHVNEDAFVFGGGDSVVREPVSVDPPCACGDDQRTDVVGIVAAAATDNENALHGIDASGLSDVAGDVDLALPAGRFFFDGVRAAGAVRITVSGPAAMFVAGDFAFAGLLEVVLDTPEASLDLFVDGDLAAAGAFDVGSASSPSKVRIYVGGDGDIAIAGAAQLGASLFAPDARVALAGDFTFDGALIARDIAAAGTLSVRYDADVLDGAGEGCTDDDGVDGDDGAGDVGQPGDDGTGDDGAGGDPPADVQVDGTCNTTADCGNQACVQGTCGACAADLDCPAPYFCSDGSCTYVSG